MKSQHIKTKTIHYLFAAALFFGTHAAASSAGEKQEPRNDVESAAVAGQVAPRLQNLGNHGFSVTTNSPRAQLFINQGLMLAYGFNHAEAARSFREAARLDPDCAMAYWGLALVIGPNINMSMPPEKEPQAHELIQKAVSLKDNVSDREKEYIDALAKRYSGEEKPDRPALDKAYAEAMRELSAGFPDDLDAATLYAESLMDLRPWDYWTRDFQPYPETVEIMRVLESVLSRNPKHPGARSTWLKPWIHAVSAIAATIANAKTPAPKSCPS